MRFAQNEGRKKAEQKFLPTKMQKPVEQKVKSVLDRFKRRDIWYTHSVLIYSYFKLVFPHKF